MSQGGTVQQSGTQQPQNQPTTCSHEQARSDPSTGSTSPWPNDWHIWEVVRAVKAARTAEPELADDGLLILVGDNTGIPLRLVRAAVRYWASYPDEIDAEIAAADAAEDAAEQAWRREHQLLAR
jgi:hypothetical protein